MQLIKLELNENDIYCISKSFNFSRSEAFFNKLIEFIENNCSLVLKRPLNEEFLDKIKVLTCNLVRQWQKIKGGYARNKIKENKIVLELNLEYFYVASSGKELTQAVKKSEKELKELKKLNNGDFIQSRKRKNYDDCSDRQKKRIKSMISSAIGHVVKALGLQNYFLNISQVMVDDKASFNVQILNKLGEKIEFNSRDILFMKDSMGISDKAYKFIRKNYAIEWPSMYALRKEKVYLNGLVPIKRQMNGVSCSIEDKLYYHILQDETFYYNLNSIDVKLSFVGTKISNSLYVLNQTFTIINQGKIAKTSNGNYVIGMYRINSEKRENIEQCFDELNKEIESLSTIELNDKEININYYICSD